MTGVEWRGKKENSTKGACESRSSRAGGRIAANSQSDMLSYFLTCCRRLPKCAARKLPRMSTACRSCRPLLGHKAFGREQVKHDYLYWRSTAGPRFGRERGVR